MTEGPAFRHVALRWEGELWIWADCQSSPEAQALEYPLQSRSPPTTLLTLVLEVLQYGDYGLQGDVVGQEELPDTVLLKGFPVQALD